MYFMFQVSFVCELTENVTTTANKANTNAANIANIQNNISTNVKTMPATDHVDLAARANGKDYVFRFYINSPAVAVYSKDISEPNYILHWNGTLS